MGRVARWVCGLVVIFNLVTFQAYKLFGEVPAREDSWFYAIMMVWSVVVMVVWWPWGRHPR